MNKEEILAKSRNENKGADEMEKQAKLQAASVSRAVGFLLCILGAMLDNIFLNNGLIGLMCWTVYWGMQATEGWVLAFGLKIKRNWITAACYTALFVLFAVAFVVRMMDFL
jgi:hypothetical protein